MHFSFFYELMCTSTSYLSMNECIYSSYWCAVKSATIIPALKSFWGGVFGGWVITYTMPLLRQSDSRTKHCSNHYLFQGSSVF